MEFLSKTNLKKSIEVHISGSIYFHCIFTTHLTSICKRKSLAEVLLIHAKKWLYRIPSVYEKRIDTGADQTAQAKHFYCKVKKYEEISTTKARHENTGNI